MSGLRCGDPLDVKIKRPPKARFIRSKVRRDALFGSGPSRPRSLGVWINENRKSGGDRNAESDIAHRRNAAIEQTAPCDKPSSLLFISLALSCRYTSTLKQTSLGPIQCRAHFLTYPAGRPL